MRKANTIAELIKFTDEKIVNWYELAREDYSVDGSGVTSYDAENNIIKVDYIENGETNTWEMVFYPGYLNEQAIDWVYNCWSSLA